MPDRCVVFGCSNQADAEKGISLHRIPFWNDERPEAKRRRKIWVNFVATKRANWRLSKLSAICSEHFVPDDYKYLVEIPGTRNYMPRLKKDDPGNKNKTPNPRRDSYKPCDTTLKRHRFCPVFALCVPLKFNLEDATHGPSEQMSELGRILQNG